MWRNLGIEELGDLLERPTPGIEVRGRHGLVMEGVVEARYRIAANPRVGVSCQGTRAWLPRGLPHLPQDSAARRQRRRIMWDAAPSVRRLG